MSNFPRREVTAVTVERLVEAPATWRKLVDAVDAARKERNDNNDPWATGENWDEDWDNEVRVRPEGGHLVVYFTRPEFGEWKTRPDGPPPDEPVTRGPYTDEPPF